MSSLDKKARGPTYWRSLDELADTPEFRSFAEREFPGLLGEAIPPATRRQFLKIMGASVAFGGLTACRWPAEEILPFAHRPEEYVPGVPVRYATAMELGGAATGLVVTSFDGRPIKVEGNPDHPLSLGGTNALAQASILGLYDPDRSRTVVHRDGGKRTAASWEDFERAAGDAAGMLDMLGGDIFHVLCEATSSPTVRAMRQKLSGVARGMFWHEYEPLSRDREREGTRLAFGRPYRARMELERADVIVSLDADFLYDHPAALRYTRQFARRRRAEDGRMNRLHVVESTFSITGSVADHRLPVPARLVAVAAGKLAARLYLDEDLPLPPGGEALRPVLERFQAHPFGHPLVDTMAEDLLAHRGRSVLVAGPRQPAEVHALLHALNASLGNSGRTVVYYPDPDPDRPTHAEAVTRMARHMEKQEVGVALILGGNPVFDAPADLEFGKRLETVKLSFHLSPYEDETSRACTWHLPRTHYLEEWGDARAWDGAISVVQPLVEPLFGGRSVIEVLSAFAEKTPRKGYDIVRATLAETFAGGNFEKVWRESLRAGVMKGTAWNAETPGLAPTSWAPPLDALAETPVALPDGELEVVFAPDRRIHDGRFANNGWLQEMPDPLTRVAWDNPALVAPATARKLDLAHGDLVTLEREGRSVDVAVCVLPGHAEGSLTVCPGSGRTACGRVGDGVGFDTYRIRTTEALHWGSFTLSKTGKKYKLADIQNHHVMGRRGRKNQRGPVGEPVREATLAEYLRDPEHAVRGVGHEPALAQLPADKRSAGHQWAMVVDLSACTGCSACVIACQAENNVPVVGKDQVAQGREMHWIRIDRYFSGPADKPSVSCQPVMCQHCEDAPCEPVCPVGATLHDQEGLNVMVYNRCIGTRDCASHCPYKVRRFNWVNTHKDVTEVEKMAFNPDVTVRGRGVMEKCTFCVQRIQDVKIQAGNEGREITDGEILPACAQACPAEAIVFGDLNDENSRVRRLHRHVRSYGLLAELGTRPRTRYLARLSNPAVDGGHDDLDVETVED